MSTPEYSHLAQGESLPPIQAANLPVVDERDASPEVKQLYQQFRDDFGRPQVPGILQCFATHPPLLEHMMGLAKEMLFTEGALGRQNKELLSAYVSASNDCAYCTDSHAFFFRVHGGEPGALEAVLACDLESRSLSAKQRNLLQFAKKITEASQSIARPDIESMHATGWTDLQIAEAIHVVALFASFNRVVNAFGLPSQDLLKVFGKEPRDATSR